MSPKECMIRLKNELDDISRKNVNSLFSVATQNRNLFIWDIKIFGPPDTIFEGGIFNCEITFPQEYPNKAPQFKFLDNLFHPNIYEDGKVCISIAHEGIDEFGYEKISERRSPTQTVETFLISIISMLASPNLESPANVSACKMWRDDFNEYKKMIYNMVSKSQN